MYRTNSVDILVRILILYKEILDENKNTTSETHSPHFAVEQTDDNGEIPHWWLIGEEIQAKSSPLFFKDVSLDKKPLSLSSVSAFSLFQISVPIASKLTFLVNQGFQNDWRNFDLAFNFINGLTDHQKTFDQMLIS